MTGRLGLGLLILGLSASAQTIQTKQVATGVTSPTDIQNAGDGTGRLFFLEQSGVVLLYKNGALTSQPFLDITAKTHGSGEQGLLGLAFPPGYASKGRFYVDYTDLNGSVTISMFRVSSNPDVADGSSETVLLRIDKPFPNHNGGQIRFGPDGYLYIGVGDGGSEGDPNGIGQNQNTLLGKLLRVDVESNPGHVQIPPDNPFVNTANVRPEIWAYGLRNPWRFSFDSATGDLWLPDVGQDAYEEVNLQPASSHGGENYGWSIMEGTHCYQANCNMQGLTQPILDYSHALGCAITGGFLYRGKASPGMRGQYIYGDYCSGRIWTLERQGTSWVNRQALASGFNITTFGIDEAGEVYVADAKSGGIYHVTGSAAPRVSAAQVVNAASFVPGLVPGGLATAFAAGVLDDPGIAGAPGIPLQGSLKGVSVTINGANAPILAVANQNGQEQVNFQVPFELQGSSASVAVVRNGQASAPVTVPVMAMQPALFTSDGVNAIVVHNADNTLVTAQHPLVAGEYAYVYANGLGAVSNAPATGAGAPISPAAKASADVRVSLGGQSCEVEFAGLAPTLVGVFQVNFRVPASTTSGANDLVVSASGTAGPTVKVAVQ